MTTSEHSVAALLDETIAALSTLDLERLLSLEESMLPLAKSGVTDDCISTLIEKQQLLKQMLVATESNLAGLARLHQRNGAETWAR